MKYFLLLNRKDVATLHSKIDIYVSFKVMETQNVKKTAIYNLCYNVFSLFHVRKFTSGLL